MSFPPNSFSHITCLYFTIYMFENIKNYFLKIVLIGLYADCYLALHLVNKENLFPN